MAYSRITGTRNGADAIDYARGNGKGHKDCPGQGGVV